MGSTGPTAGIVGFGIVLGIAFVVYLGIQCVRFLHLGIRYFKRELAVTQLPEAQAEARQAAAFAAHQARQLPADATQVLTQHDGPTVVNPRPRP